MKSLDDCLASEKLFNELMVIAKEQWCTENLNFLQEVKNYEKASQNEMKKFAEKIFNTFISSTSEQEINISQQLKNQIQTKLNENDINKDLFEDARIAVYRLVEGGVYEVWLKK